MTIDFFLDKLNRIDFDPEVMREYEFAEDEIQEAMNAFIPSKKDNYNSTSDDILVKFIEEHDTNFGVISNISFSKEIKETEKFIILGAVRGDDYLAIEKKSKQIVAIAPWDYETIVVYVAASSEAFLEAFLHNGIGYIGKEFSSDLDRYSFMSKRIQHAISAAGGNKYAEFWTHLYPVKIP